MLSKHLPEFIRTSFEALNKSLSSSPTEVGCDFEILALEIFQILDIRTINLNLNSELIAHEQMIYFKSQLKYAMLELYNIIFSLYFMDLLMAVRI